MASVFIRLGQGGAPSWKSDVSTAANLPAFGNAIGDVRVSLDSNTIYIWSGIAWNPSAGGGSGVSSLNSLIGAVNLLAGSGISIIPSGNNLTIATTGGVTYPLSAPNGTAAAPSYSFTSSTNTGMYLASVGNLGLTAAGSEIINISALGTVLNSGLSMQIKTVSTNYSIL